MKYNAIANPALYHCGEHWLVVDESYNTVSKHVDRKSAENKAKQLNGEGLHGGKLL